MSICFAFSALMGSTEPVKLLSSFCVWLQADSPRHITAVSDMAIAEQVIFFIFILISSLCCLIIFRLELVRWENNDYI